MSGSITVSPATGSYGDVVLSGNYTDVAGTWSDPNTPLVAVLVTKSGDNYTYTQIGIIYDYADPNNGDDAGRNGNIGDPFTVTVSLPAGTYSVYSNSNGADISNVPIAQGSQGTIVFIDPSNADQVTGLVTSLSISSVGSLARTSHGGI